MLNNHPSIIRSLFLHLCLFNVICFLVFLYSLSHSISRTLNRKVGPSIYLSLLVKLKLYNVDCFRIAIFWFRRIYFSDRLHNLWLDIIVLSKLRANSKLKSSLQSVQFGEKLSLTLCYYGSVSRVTLNATQCVLIQLTGFLPWIFPMQVHAKIR